MTDEQDSPRAYTFAQASELTRLSVDALRKRVARGKLRSSKSNVDDLLRVWLTVQDIDHMKSTGRPEDDDQTSSGRPVDSQKIRGLEELAEALSRADTRVEMLLTEMAALRENVAQERERAGRAEGDRDRLLQQQQDMTREAERLRAELGQVRETAAAADATIQAEREARHRVETERDTARAELQDWTAGGPFRRAIRAFVSRRG